VLLHPHILEADERIRHAKNSSTHGESGTLAGSNKDDVVVLVL
jgi:hypothetical protein